jgi:hypothetical protein
MPKILKSIDANGQRLTNMADGSSATDAVTLQQMQAFVRGLDWKELVRAASTGNLNLSSPGASIDGVSMSSGDRFLAKDQSTGSQNGIYVWNGAAAAATRANDADTSAKVTSGLATTVTEGTANGDKLFVLTTNDPIVLNTTALVFSQLGGGGTTYTADGQGIELSGSQFSLELDGTTLSKSASGLRVGSGAAGAGLVEATGVLAVGAGTGITVNADDVAIDTSIVTRKYAADCAATTNPQTFTHNLGTKDVTVEVVEVSTGNTVLADVTRPTTNTVSVDFGGAPSAAQYRVLVRG